MNISDLAVKYEDEPVAGPSGCSGEGNEPNDEPADEPSPSTPQRRWKFLTGYFKFLADFREDNKGKNWKQKEITRKAGEAWCRLSDADKKPYKEAAMKNIEKEGKKRKRAGRCKKRRVCSEGRKKMSRSRKTGRTTRIYRRRNRHNSDYETDDTSTTTDFELPRKRRKPAKQKGSTRSCICGMKHRDPRDKAPPLRRKNKRKAVRKRSREEDYDSDTTSMSSSTSYDSTGTE